MSSNRPNLSLDENAFEDLLAAAFTIQEHYDRLKHGREAEAPVHTEPHTVYCEQCGEEKPSAGARCQTCEGETLRPGERLQRNWASMWLHSDSSVQQIEQAAPFDESAIEDATSAPMDTASQASQSDFEYAEIPLQPLFSESSFLLSPAAENEEMPERYLPHAGLSSISDGAELISDSVPAVNKFDAPALLSRFSELRVKLRFQRADLYLGLSIFVAAVALLWPSAVPPQPAALDPWERALVTLGLAEAPAPLVHAQGDPSLQVWIDPHTALYYCPGDDQYQKTEGGRLSSQREAQMDRFEPASRSACD